MAALRGGTLPGDTATSVRVGTLADRVQANFAAAMGHVAGVLGFLKSEVSALGTALRAEAAAQNTAIRTDLGGDLDALESAAGTADAGLQSQINTKAPINNAALTGAPTTTTPAAAENSTRIPTTGWVRSTIAALMPNLSGYAPLASPALSGNPTAPYPAAASDTFTIPTTSWCRDTFADWNTVNGKANAFNAALTGAPTAASPAHGDRSSRIATTTYVMEESDAVEAYLIGEINAIKLRLSNAGIP